MYFFKNEISRSCNLYGRDERRIPEGKRPLGRPRRKWEDNIRMDFQEVGCGDMDLIVLAQDRDSCGRL